MAEISRSDAASAAFDALLWKFVEAVNEGRNDEVETLQQEIASHAEPCADYNLTPEQQSVAELFARTNTEPDSIELTPVLAALSKADECAERGSWNEAEQVLLAALADNGLKVWDAIALRCSLAEFHRMLCRAAECLQLLRASVALAEHDETIHPLLRFRVLHLAARNLSRLGHVAEAQSLVDRMATVLQDDPDMIPAVKIALEVKILLVRAECALARGELAEVERVLSQARQKLDQPRPELRKAPAPQNDLALWWSISARLHEARDDMPSATTGWRESLAIRRYLATLPYRNLLLERFELAESLEAISSALRLTGQESKAAPLELERDALLAELHLG